MKRILIVDDEKYFRKALIVSIPWETMDYTVCGEAENGVDALEKTKALEPDVIATDINMSKMDGLEFIAALREIKPDIKIIVISGYNDFDYVKRSLVLGVHNYIVKPVDPEEFSKSLREVSLLIDKERGIRQRVSSLRKNLDASIRMLHSQTLSKLLQGNVPSDMEALRELLNRYQIDLREGPFTVAALEVRGQNENIWSMDDQRLWTYAVENVAGELLRGSYPGEIYAEELGRVYAILQCGAGDGEKLCQLLFSLRCLLQDQLGLEVAIGVGNAVASLQDLHTSCKEALYAIKDSGGNLAEGGVCLYGDVSSVELLGNGASLYDKSELLMQMRLGNTEACKELLQSLERRLSDNRAGLPIVQMTLVEVLAAFFAYASENADCLAESFSPVYSGFFRDIVSSQNLHGLFARAQEIMYSLMAQVSQRQQSKVSQIVSQVLAIIHNHYSENDLTVDRLAQETYTSYGYLCYLFKRDMGKTLGDYITDYRMEQARQMLLQGDRSVSEVAEAVGFSNPNYFSKKFKRTFGMLPSSFCSKNKENLIYTPEK